MSGIPSLSVLVLSWNTKQFLRELLESMVVHALPSGTEVIVIDNASADDSADMVRKNFPEVRLAVNGRNEGYARGENQAFALSCGENILLLGSDTRLHDDSINRMVAYLDGHPETAGVACRLLNDDGSLQHSCHRFPSLLDGVLTYLSLHSWARRYNLAEFDYGRTQDVEQPAATCLMLRRSVIERVGFFDERYTILYNDVDLCRRIARAGFRLTYLADASIYHHGSSSTKIAPAALRFEMYRNILCYYRTGFGWKAILCLSPILGVRFAVTVFSRIARRKGQRKT